MSADNGIYILESDGPEWRVIEAQAIENINWNPDTGSSFNMEEVKRYFGKCRIFTDRKAAETEAFRMEEETLNDQMCPILEYGISTIRFPHKFPV